MYYLKSIASITYKQNSGNINTTYDVFGGHDIHYPK